MYLYTHVSVDAGQLLIAFFGSNFQNQIHYEFFKWQFNKSSSGEFISFFFFFFLLKWKMLHKNSLMKLSGIHSNVHVYLCLYAFIALSFNYPCNGIFFSSTWANWRGFEKKNTLVFYEQFEWRRQKKMCIHMCDSSKFLLPYS